MKLQDRYWPLWIAATGRGRIGAGYRGKRGDAPGKFTGQQIGHAAAIRKAGRVDTQRINAQRRLQMTEKIAREKNIVHSWP